MRVSSVSVDYALVFYQVCKENKIETEVIYELEKIKELSENLKDILVIPIISKKIKKELLDTLVDEGFRIEVVNLIKILIDNKHVNLLDEIIDATYHHYQHDNKILIVNVTVSKKLKDYQSDTLIKGLEKKLNEFIVVIFKEDPSIIGGLKIEYDGKIIDNTIKRHLKQIARI